MTMVDKISKVIETNPDFQMKFDEMIKYSLLTSMEIMGEVFEYGDMTESEAMEYSIAWNEVVTKRANDLYDVVFGEL